MRIITKHIVLLFLLFEVITSQAQNEFVTPKKVKSIFQSHVVLKDQSDLDYFVSHLPEMQHVDVLKVNGDVDISKVAILGGKVDALDEIQLIQYQGIISDFDLEKMEWVPHLYVYIPENRVDAILLNDIWSRIDQITLEFEQVPLDYTFFKGWKATKNLRLLGDFNKIEAKAAIDAAYQFLPRLQHLDITLVSLLDLPESIRPMYSTIFGVIDGSAWAQGISVEEMGRVEIPIYRGAVDVAVGTGNNKGRVSKKIFSAIYWYSDQPKVYAQEKRFLKSLFPEPDDFDKQGFVFDEIPSSFDFVESIPLVNKEISTSEWNPLIEDFGSGKATDLGTTDRDMVFLGESEWAVLIPKSSLQYKNGVPYQGEYKISVNYMNSPERISAMGLSLRYDTTAERPYVIRPDFVIDVEVFDMESKSLMLKSGYRAQIRYVSQTLKDSRFYAFHEKKWKHFYDYDYAFDAERMASTDFYQFYQGNKTGVISTSWEKSGLSEQFNIRGYQCLLTVDQTHAKVGKAKGYFLNMNPKPNDEQKRVVKGKNYFTFRFFKKNPRKPSPYQEFMLRPRDLELFPEWKYLSETRFAVESNASYEQLKRMFKGMNIVDARLVPTGKGANIEFKTTRQAWSIKLVVPRERRDFTESDKEREQKRWQRKMLGRYLKVYREKNLWYKSLSQSQYQQSIESQSNQVLGMGRLKPGYSRGGFFIQSFGRFCWGTPQPIKGNAVKLLLCETGKIPLKLERAFLVSQDGKNYNYQVCDAQNGCDWKVNNRTIKYILAKSKDAHYYYLKGMDYQRLGIDDQTLIYIDLKPVESAEVMVDYDLRRLLGIRSKRR